MGFQKTAPAKGGIVVADAYHRIAYVRGDPSRPDTSRVYVDSYRDKAARDAAPDDFFERREYTGIGILAVGNWKQQLYLDVKASGQHDGFFADAADVLD